MQYKLGKTAARPGAISLTFGSYITNALPKPPEVGGHKDLLSQLTIGMLANNQYGDCVWAGAAHETLLWNEESNRFVLFTDGGVLSDYGAVTGFTPNDPATDNGTDMQIAAKYRQTTGILDSHGTRHKIGAYVALATKGTKCVAEIKQAIHLFGAVGIGIQFPNTAMDQFKAGHDWTPVKEAHIEGGHYIPAISYDKDWVYVVTWGKIIRASWAFIKKYMDEGLAYLSPEMLEGGKSLEGFNLAQLQADLAAIKSA